VVSGHNWQGEERFPPAGFAGAGVRAGQAMAGRRVKAIEGQWSGGAPGACLYYPLWFVGMSVRWKRLFGKAREEAITICVDAVRGVALRTDGVPDAVEREVPDEAVMAATVNREEALSRAEELARWWARTRLHSWWAPVTRADEVTLLHKVYVLERVQGRTLVKDSVTGETGPLPEGSPA